jgi:hypothetical protein
MRKQYECGAYIKNNGTMTAQDERFGIKNGFVLWRHPS